MRRDNRWPRRSTAVTGSTRLAVDPRYPNAAFERLEADAHGLGSACHLGAAADFTVGKIGSYQINQGGAGLAGLRRRQRMRENARLYVVAPRRIPDHAALEAIENDQNRTQGIVRHIARSASPPDEAQVQQAADAATFVMQAQCKGSLQFGYHQDGFGRDLIGVRRDYDFREMFCRQVRTLCFYSNDAARRSAFWLPSESRFQSKRRSREPV